MSEQAEKVAREMLAAECEEIEAFATAAALRDNSPESSIVSFFVTSDCAIRAITKALNTQPASTGLVEALRETLLDVTASLAAACSLLGKSPKTAAPSNKMFDQMLADYEASLSRARAALSQPQGEG